jgi:hypothetical protein
VLANHLAQEFEMAIRESEIAVADQFGGVGHVLPVTVLVGGWAGPQARRSSVGSERSMNP